MSRLHKQENFCSQVSRLLSCSGTVIHNFEFVIVFYTKSILRFCSIKVRMLRNCNFEILELQELKCNFKKDQPRYEVGLVGGQIFMGPRLFLCILYVIHYISLSPVFRSLNASLLLYHMVHLEKFCKGDLWENKRFPFLGVSPKALIPLKFIQILYKKEMVSIVFQHYFLQVLCLLDKLGLKSRNKLKVS